METNSQMGVLVHGMAQNALCNYVSYKEGVISRDLFHGLISAFEYSSKFVSLDNKDRRLIEWINLRFFGLRRVGNKIIRRIK